MRTPRFSALVAVADPALRQDVVRGLAALGASDVVEAGSVAETRARTRTGPPRDLLVVEIGLPDGSGVALLGELRAAGWQRGIVLAADGDPFSVRAALAATAQVRWRGERPGGRATGAAAGGPPARATRGRPAGRSGRHAPRSHGGRVRRRERPGGGRRRARLRLPIRAACVPRAAAP